MGVALWGGKQEEIARRKEVTLIQNEHMYLQFFCTSWISLLDILEIIQLSEIMLFGLNKRLRAPGFLFFLSFFFFLKGAPTCFKHEDV